MQTSEIGGGIAQPEAETTLFEHAASEQTAPVRSLCSACITDANPHTWGVAQVEERVELSNRIIILDHPARWARGRIGACRQWGSANTGLP